MSVKHRAAQCQACAWPSSCALGCPPACALITCIKMNQPYSAAATNNSRTSLRSIILTTMFPYTCHTGHVMRGQGHLRLALIVKSQMDRQLPMGVWRLSRRHTRDRSDAWGWAVGSEHKSRPHRQQGWQGAYRCHALITLMLGMSPWLCGARGIVASQDPLATCVRVEGPSPLQDTDPTRAAKVVEPMLG